jgi:hypothetical protein
MHTIHYRPGFNLLHLIFFFSLISISRHLGAQSQVYDNFEGSRVLNYGYRSGTLDENHKNPAADQVNGSPKCAKYIRNAKQKYDCIKMKPNGKFSDVSTYSSYLGNASKLKLKVFTNAPVGTLIEIQLARVTNSTPYPADIHSQYQAYTTVTNQWEELEFTYAQTPPGSETGPNDVKELILMFDPNSSTRYTFYFDDLTGPPTVTEPIVTQTKKKEFLWKQREK